MSIEPNRAAPTQRDLYRLRMEVVVSSLSYAASGMYLDCVSTDPGPNDDAEMELKETMLQKAITEYVSAWNTATPEEKIQ